MKSCSYVRSVASLTSDQNKTRCSTSNSCISEAFKVDSCPRSTSTCSQLRVYIFEPGKSVFCLTCIRENIFKLRFYISNKIKII